LGRLPAHGSLKSGNKKNLVEEVCSFASFSQIEASVKTENMDIKILKG